MCYFVNVNVTNGIKEQNEKLLFLDITAFDITDYFSLTQNTEQSLPSQSSMETPFFFPSENEDSPLTILRGTE